MRFYLRIFPLLNIISVVLVVSGCIPQDRSAPQARLSIHSVQGAGHISPWEGQFIQNIYGIVTSVKDDGFYLQEPQPDQLIATSEGLFVYTGERPEVSSGDEVTVSGKVEEYYPGGLSSGNLSITEVTDPRVERLSSNNPLPAPVIIGRGGRIPPGERIKQNTVDFLPEAEGLDFYESLEGMLVQINDAVACGPTNTYGETSVLADQGLDAGLRTARGGIILRASDPNPERILLDDTLQTLPDLNVGDWFRGATVGVLDYSFGNYKVLVLSDPDVIPGNLQPEISAAASSDELSVASMNLENLDPADGIERFAGFADLIVNHLRSPDIIVLNEVQDNNGPIEDDVTDASQTYTLLIQAIESAGGPSYTFREIPPELNQDGGDPGGNIRTGFLFRNDREIQFSDRVPVDGVVSATIQSESGKIILKPNPARIDPTNPAFQNSRKPLIGQFQIHGTPLFIIGVHLVSRLGDTPLFGRYQPPLAPSEKQRMQQVKTIRKIIDTLLKVDPHAKVLVLGDFNDFQFSQSISALVGHDLNNLVSTLPIEKQYNYIYDGNAQVLDQMIASSALFQELAFYDAVHVNSEFASSRRLSDHDPVLARFLGFYP